jgi:hypothetical protein
LVDYPSKPILAEAAATLMKKHMLKILKHLLSNIVCNIADAGTRGELVSKILLLLAKDNLISNMENFSRIVTVKEFVTALIGEDHCQKLKLPECHLNFTHFIRLHYEPTEQTLKDMYLHCGAGSCKLEQNAIDMVIPVALQNGKLEPLYFRLILLHSIQYIFFVN